jgi:hypothetical protein
MYTMYAKADNNQQIIFCKLADLLFCYSLIQNKKATSENKFHLSLCVRVEGLEPPSLAALDPKSSVSTNFTTPASSKRSAKVMNNIGFTIDQQNIF